MNNRRIALIIMTFSFIMIVSGSVSTFIIGLKNDRIETYKRIDVVNDEFEIFSTNTSVFESLRDELYEKYLSDIFYDTMSQDDIEVKNMFSNYEHLVDELEKTTNKLNNTCSDVYFPDSSANSKCSNYKSIYEQVNNYFVSDVILYNGSISKFNEYQKENNSNLQLNDYVTKRDYIDYNNDKKYDGKEE